MVTSEWTVILLDHNLKVLWETSLQDHFSVNYAPMEVTVLIRPHEMLVGDEGVVVVGGRTRRINRDGGDLGSTFEADTDPSSTSTSSTSTTTSDSETALEKERREAEERNEAKVRSQAGHFSYYALDGRSGTLRWHHELSDFSQNLHEEEVMHPQRNYKLEVGAGPGKHDGELDWRVFADSLIEQLPFSWQGPEDTRLDMAHFTKGKRRRVAASEDENPPSAAAAVKVPVAHRHDANAKTDSWVSGVLLGAGGPRTGLGSRAAAAAALVQPNVIVARVAEGIEVLHLYTGRPVCKITLFRGVYDDINGDGVIDHAVPIVGEEYESLTDTLDDPPVLCRGAIFAGVPALEQVANSSICDDREMSMAALGPEARSGKELLSGVNPVVLHRYSPTTGQLAKHVVFLLSSGRLTSVAYDGREDWQIATRSRWNTDYARRLANNEESGTEMYTTVPSLQVFRPFADSSDAVEDLILAAGDEYLTLVDHAGYVLATIHTPEFPVAPPIAADFSGDGHTDILVLARAGIYAYEVDARIGVTFVRVVLWSITIILIGFWAYAQAEARSSARSKYKKAARSD